VKIQDAKHAVSLTNQIEHLEHEKNRALKGELFDVQLRGGAFPQFSIAHYDIPVPLIEMQEAALKVLIATIDQEIEKIENQIKTI